MGIKTIACGLSHSGTVLEDGSVFLWGIAGDIQHSKEHMEKCLLRKPTKISFKNAADGSSYNGGTSQRRVSNIHDEGIFIEDLKLGE